MPASPPARARSRIYAMRSLTCSSSPWLRPPRPRLVELIPKHATDASVGSKSTLASTRIYLIRHADVENPRRLLYGHLDGFQLTALGRAQAVAVGDSLRTVNLRRIVHSPLARAVETAELINSRLVPPAILEADPDRKSVV